MIKRPKKIDSQLTWRCATQTQDTESKNGLQAFKTNAIIDISPPLKVDFFQKFFDAQTMMDSDAFEDADESSAFDRLRSMH